MKALGDYINGSFHGPAGHALVSRNPARDGAPVLETAWSAARMALACDAASEAARAWAARSDDERWEVMCRFRETIAASADSIAEAIVLETGKLRTEARGEVSALVNRFELVRSLIADDLRSGPLPGRPFEQLRHHPLGVVGVVGPFNYPAHLCHAYVVPALLTGNAVVMKPSEVAPLVGQRYAEAALAAGMPAGVLNVVQGGGAAGAALTSHAAVRGLCFTGSYETGRRIKEQSLDRPELLLALEMGGKNTVVVLDDADVRQAAHEIVVGGYLTTGQRCTATDRVLVHRSCAEDLIELVRKLVASIRFGDPDDKESFAGPLATDTGRDRFEAAIRAARAAGAEPLVEGGRQEGGFYARPSLHRLPDGVHAAPGYTDAELFGPDVGIEVVADDDEAIAVLDASPYGFANSIFTESTERFERFYRETRSGILNRNRSTNLASPRLPFGGVGRSGNYRPAGAHAPRNVVVPMAVQENVLGTVQTHAMLAEFMPAHDLDRLEARHAREEAREAARALVEFQRPMGLRRPSSGRLPESEAWLTRLYAGERIVREKKPGVFDHLRSGGAWFVSVDEQPLSVLDGMSQTATLCGGFSEDQVVRAYFEGEFGDTLVSSADTSDRSVEPARAFADTLRHLVPGLPHVAFANSGAEANEKALALCRLDCPRADAKKVLAFEGSFHGRTLLALHATFNPAKRGPFEIAGYECEFAPFPVWDTPSREEPRPPSGFLAAASTGEIEELRGRFGDASEDSLLADEVASLGAVHAKLASGEYFACVVEPMQSEGGDRYATARFFKALRLLTRFHKVNLVFDEVQTGFGLGGSFAWHHDFRLVTARGRMDAPDAVVFAKRAQVGVVMSRFEDPEPTSTHAASLVRGRVHAEMMTMSHDAERVEKLVQPLLDNIATAFPHLVAAPRCRGYAVAFDLPSPEHLKAYLGQRFWRGAIVFGAGSRTVRYRLSTAYHAREVRMLFEMVRRSLSWLDAHPHQQPPAWEDEPNASRRREPGGDYAVSIVDGEDALALLPAMLDIEYQIYEPARRTPPAQIRAALVDPDGVVSVAEVRDGDSWQLVGFAIGAPLEASGDEEGPDRDPMLGDDSTLYSLSLTVASEHQGQGLGRAMKQQMLREASTRRSEDGTLRFRYVTSRNRVGHTAAMSHLNRVLGAHTVEILTGQYEDPEGQAVYCRIPLSPLAPASSDERPATSLELSAGVARPFATPPASLLAAQDSGLLYGPAVNKLTLVNYVTPAVVRCLEWVGALEPTLPHLYLTSCRDELVDKSLRLLKWHRPDAGVVIGFEGGYVGHTTAAARSISDPATHAQGPTYFDWPRVPHPALAGVSVTIAAIRGLAEEHGDALFGLMCEVVQERTGLVVPDDFWSSLASLRAEHDVPLVLVETASAAYRSGGDMFAHSHTAAEPDVLAWWGGAQTGYLHVGSRFRVAKPLAMVSTWDGDELSLVRENHQLRAARGIDQSAGIAALDEALSVCAERGVQAHGLGLYRVVELGERASAVVDAASRRGMRARCFPGGRLCVAPALDEVAAVAAGLGDALREVL